MLFINNMKRIKKATKWSLVIQNAAKRKLNYTTSAAALANYNNNINNNNNKNNDNRLAIVMS